MTFAEYPPQQDTSEGAALISAEKPARPKDTLEQIRRKQARKAKIAEQKRADRTKNLFLRNPLSLGISVVSGNVRTLSPCEISVCIRSLRAVVEERADYYQEAAVLSLCALTSRDYELLINVLGGRKCEHFELDLDAGTWTSILTSELGPKLPAPTENPI